MMGRVTFGVLCSACLLLQLVTVRGCDYLTAYTNSASLESDNYPQPYNPGTSKCWIIVADNGSHQIMLTTVEFNTEANSDIVRVHDGNSDASEKLAEWSGSLLTSVVLSSGSTLYVSFTSDNGLEEQGFQIQYSSTNDVLGRCFLRQATEATEHLQSPGYPLFYSNGVDLCWVIKAADRTSSIHILFDSIQLEQQVSCNADFITIRQGETSSSPLIGTYCSSELPGEIVVPGGSAHVQFITDFFVTSVGFKLAFSTETLESETTGDGCAYFTASTTPGYVKSPDFPFDYQPYTDTCYVLLSPSPSEQVRLEVLDSHLEEASDDNVCYDYVRVRDGSTPTGPILREWCGTDATPGTLITSISSALYIEFHSDETLQERGFNIEYKVIQVEEEVTKLTAYQAEVTLTSPGYPGNYPANLDMSWIVESPDPTQRVRLTVRSIHLQDSPDCSADYLEIRDGSYDYSQLEARLCGVRTTDQVYISSGRDLHLHFHTDGNEQHPGFTAVYDLYSSHTADECTEYPVSTTLDTFTSPLYPSEYPASLYLCWQLIGEDRERPLRIIIVEMKLETSTNCNHDYLEITDGYDPDFSPTLGRWCGEHSYLTVETTQSVAHILFVADGSLQYTGFLVEFYQPEEESSNSTLIIVIGVVVAVVLVAAIVAGVFCFLKSRKKPTSTTDGRPPVPSVPTVSEGVYLEPIPSQPKAAEAQPYNHYTGTPTNELDRPLYPSLSAAHSTPHLYEYPMDNDGFMLGTPPSPPAPISPNHISPRTPQDPNLRFSAMDNAAFDSGPRTPTPPLLPPRPQTLAPEHPAPESPRSVAPTSPEPVPTAPRESYAMDNEAFEPTSPNPSLNLSGYMASSPSQELIGQPSLTSVNLEPYIRIEKDNRAFEA